MKGFMALGSALACTAVAVAVFALPAPRAEPIDRMHDCGHVITPRFRAEVAIRGTSCRRARPLLRSWLETSRSPAGEGLPRSARTRHWQCRPLIAWSCEVNGRDVRMVFGLELRRRGDLWGAVTTAFASGPAGETWLDYGIVVRNAGTDAVPATVVDGLPAGTAFVSASRGSCVVRAAAGRLRCSLGPVPPGFDDGTQITVRVSYDCSSNDPIGPSRIALSSPAGDLDLSDNVASVDELDPVCPDPFFDDPLPPDDPFPPDDPGPPDDPAT